MIGIGFKILARTPVPKLPPSYPPSPTPRGEHERESTLRKMSRKPLANDYFISQQMEKTFRINLAHEKHWHKPIAYVA